MKLIAYHHFFEKNSEISHLLEALETMELQHKASDLIKYGFSHDDLNVAVNRAMTICNTGNISLKTNFKKIYVSNKQGIATDWMLSALARKLVLLNSNVNNPITARIHLNLVKNM